MIYETIKAALDKKGLSFADLERHLSGKPNNNLSNALKNNSRTIPRLEKIFELLEIQLKTK